MYFVDIGFWTTVCKTVRPMLSDHCPVCDVGVMWPNGNCWTDQDETWHADRPRLRPHCVRWGPSPPKGAHLKLAARCPVSRCWPSCCICDTPLNCYHFIHQSYPFAHLTSFRRITRKFTTAYGSLVIQLPYCIRFSIDTGTD